MDSMSVGVLAVIVLVVCVFVAILRAVLRINKSVEQRDKIIELLTALNQPDNKEKAPESTQFFGRD